MVHRVSAGGNASLSGLTTTAKAVYAVLLWQSAGRPVVIVVDGNKQAEDLSEAIGSFFSLLVADDRYGPQLLPALDVLPMRNLSPHAEICEQRAIGLWSLAIQRTPITILPAASALLRIEPADYYRQLTLRLRAGEELPLEEVVQRSDILILCAPHRAYRKLDLGHKVTVDIWNFWGRGSQFTRSRAADGRL